MRKVFVLALATVISLAVLQTASGQDKKAAAPKKAAATAAAEQAIALTPSDIKWGDAPAVFPPGAKMAVLYGNPAEKGLYVVRLKTPDGYKIPAHWHPQRESVTVISGMFYLGMGDKLDETKGMAMPAGSFGSMPAKMRHFAWVKGDTEVQVHGMGPFQLTYVDPADDPTKAKK